MKTYGGVNVKINIFPTSAPVGDELTASLPGLFTPGIGGWVGLDDVEKTLGNTHPYVQWIQRSVSSGREAAGT
jgi:hypothetical protein